MPQPPLTALRAFEAVARLGSFSAAAKALFVSQSAVSHQVRHLEEWLGRPLFDRRGARPSLLPHARDLARDLSLALSGIETACARARAERGPDMLTVAAIPSVAVCWLIPRLPSFREAHPGIPIRIVYAHHGQESELGDVHLAFVYSAAEPVLPGFRSEPFLPGTSIPVCSPSLLDGMEGGAASGFLAAGLLHDTDTTGWAGWFAQAGLDAPPELDGPVFEDFNLLRAAALSGQGVALCPPPMIRSDLDRGHLVQLSDVAVLGEFRYHLLSTMSEDAAVRAMAATFREWALAARGDAAREAVCSGVPRD